MDSMRNDRIWKARWIGAGFLHWSWQAPSKPAPYFRKTFKYDGKARKAEVFFCGLGWSELYLNGQKVGDAVLSPTVSQYDRRSRYVCYDITELLECGENTLGVILGNGWYDCSTAEVWHFDKASWTDYPKFILEVIVDGKIVVFSDESWRCLKEDGPIRFNELRNGEFYDARKEITNWGERGFDDSGWGYAQIVPGPGGVLTEQSMPPCKVIKRLPVRKVFRSIGGHALYDMGQNITGWVHIKVRGGSWSASDIALRRADQLPSGSIAAHQYF